MGAGRRKKKLDANAKRKTNPAKPRQQAKRPRGAPKKIIPLDEVVRLAAKGMPMSGIAERIGVSQRTIMARKAEDPKFSDAFDRAVRDGSGQYDEDLFSAYQRGIRKKTTRIILDAMSHWRLMHGERPEEKPLLLEIPLAAGSVLLVPEGLDPIQAIQHAEHVLKVRRDDDV